KVGNVRVLFGLGYMQLAQTRLIKDVCQLPRYRFSLKRYRGISKLHAVVGKRHQMPNRASPGKVREILSCQGAGKLARPVRAVVGKDDNIIWLHWLWRADHRWPDKFVRFATVVRLID